MSGVRVFPAGVRARTRKPTPAGNGPPVILARKRPGLEAVPARAGDRAPPERWQHGQDREDPIAPRMPTNVMHGVDMLVRAEVIDYAEQVAASRFAEDYLFGVEGVRDPSLGGGHGDAHEVAMAKAMALGRHREIAETIGPRMTEWLVSFIVLDLSFVAMADRYWPGETGRKEMRGAMATMLLLLSRLYVGLDRRRKRHAP